MRYSIEPRDKNMSKNNGKNISSKHSQKLFDRAKQSATNAFKAASMIAIPQTAKATWFNW